MAMCPSFVGLLLFVRVRGDQPLLCIWGIVSFDVRGELFEASKTQLDRGFPAHAAIRDFGIRPDALWSAHGLDHLPGSRVERILGKLERLTSPLVVGGTGNCTVGLADMAASREQFPFAQGVLALR